MKKSDSRKTSDEHVIIKKILQKSYEKLRTKLCKTYEKLTTTLQVSYKNVKFAASAVIQETLCQRLLLVKYFELKITDEQSEDFLRMLSKKTYHFHKNNLTKSYLTDLQKTYENLTTNLGKILQKSYKVSKIRPRVSCEQGVVMK